MKKLLLSTIVLLAFSCALIIFQLSCKKSADANTTTTNNTVQQQNKVILVKNINNGTASNYDAFEFWSTNYDGTATQKINITLPTNMVICDANVKISPDGKTLFFTVCTIGPDPNNPTKTILIGNGQLYACNIDGTNPHQINYNNGVGGLQLGLVY